jgi:dTDP-4-dehydrorhamnose reductase
MPDARRVLVLGSAGMLGSECVRVLRTAEPSWRISTAARDGTADHVFDVESAETSLADIIEAEQCEFIINCIALLAADIGDRPERVALAVLVNSWFPHVLAAAADRHGCKVVHISTDGVFSGSGASPLSELARPDPIDVYGLSKVLGESTAPNALTIRCSIVGRDRRGRGITEWYLNADQNAPVSGFVDYLSSPVTAPQVARFLHRTMSGSAFDLLREEGHVVHFAPNDCLSKVDYLRLLRRIAGRGAPIEAAPGPSGPVSRVLKTVRRSMPDPHGDVEWDTLIAELLQNDWSI